MNIPDITLENYEAVYDFYRERPINPRVAQFGYAVLSLFAWPRVAYAEGAQEEVDDIVSAGGRIVLAPNHLNLNDQNVIAALARKETTLRPLLCNTFGPGKVPLFKIPLLREGLTEMGAIPAFRKGDISKDVAVNREYAETWQRLARLMLIDVSIERMNRGENMIIFPEGTRNRSEDTDRIAELKQGLGRIVCGVKDSSDIGILPIGMHVRRNPFRPHLYLGNLMHGPFEDHLAVTAEMQSRLQSAVDAARSM